MRTLRVLPALCAVLVPATIMAGCGGVPGSAVATVDGEAIKQESFDHWLAVAAKSSGQPLAQVPKPPNYVACVKQNRKTQPKPAKGQTAATDAQLKQECKQQYDALRAQALQLLVSSRWIEGEASEMGISVKDSEIKKTFEQQVKQNFPKAGAYKKFLKSSGQTEQDIMLRVRIDVLSNKIRNEVTKGNDKVTDQQVADYYKANKARFGQPEQRDLRIVLTKTKAKAEKAEAALAGGAGWNAVAKEYSIDRASKSQGGRLPAVIRGQQEKALDEAVFDAKKGRIIGPVKTQFGFYVFEVVKVSKASQQTLPQAKPVIKQLLASQNDQKKLDDWAEKFRDEWRAKTECREGYATQDCKNGPKPAPAANTGQQPQPQPQQQQQQQQPRPKTDK